MKKNINALVLTGFGLNCDQETAYALEIAGAKANRVHINSLIDKTVNLNTFQIIVFIGGFSWGDDHGAGVIQAVRMKTHLGEELISFVNKGNLVLGICNGFQTLVNLGLLPGFDNDYTKRLVSLTFNDIGNFRNSWVSLKSNSNSCCVFTKGLDFIELPVRHGEGKFYADEKVIEKLSIQNQIVLTYTKTDVEPANQIFPYNPNGSIRDIAGICDLTGRIFGLMPHPEAYNHWTNHPNWTLHKEILKRQNKKFEYKNTFGNKIFKNAINYFL